MESDAAHTQGGESGQAYPSGGGSGKKGGKGYRSGSKGISGKPEGGSHGADAALPGGSAYDVWYGAGANMPGKKIK